MAVAEGYLWSNPAALLFTPRECRRAATRVMTVEEVRQLFSVLDVRQRLIARLALLAGMRPGEIFGLKWARMEADLSRDRSSEGKGMQTFQFQTKKTIEEIRAAVSPATRPQCVRCLSFRNSKESTWIRPPRKSKNRAGDVWLLVSEIIRQQCFEGAGGVAPCDLAESRGGRRRFSSNAHFTFERVWFPTTKTNATQREVICGDRNQYRHHRRCSSISAPR